ncbi:MAG: FKBP-type peptidyl-prolyl cis-trans isomerase [Microbacteriaceae bacterium]|nr:FKBP-type peptidyl-prolyl cis-trans isomerase [Microbacteriaceae bacterium]
MRKTLGLLVVPAIALSLAACAGPALPALDGGTPIGQASCTPIWERGGLAADVTATGDFGAEVEAEFPTPLVSHDAHSVALLEAGDGPVIAPTDFVLGNSTFFDGATGGVIAQLPAELRQLGSATGRLYFDAAACQTVGSRVALAASAAEFFGEDVATANGIDPDATLVGVFDIQQAFISQAQGSDVPPLNGLPTVSRLANGRPGLSFTNAPAPTDLRIAPLIAGRGTKVQDGDTVLVHYTGVLWGSHKVFDSSWEQGLPAQFQTGDGIEGFSKAVVGQTVGSQVLVAIPPAFGYGDNPPSGIAPDDTLVFVIDILGTTPAS